MELIEAVILLDEDRAGRLDGGAAGVADQRHRSSAAVALVDVLVCRIDVEAAADPGSKAQREGRTIALRQVRDHRVVRCGAVVKVPAAPQGQLRARRELSTQPKIPDVVVVLMQYLRGKLVERDGHGVKQLPVGVLQVAQERESGDRAHGDSPYELVGQANRG